MCKKIRAAREDGPDLRFFQVRFYKSVYVFLEECGVN